MLIQPEWMYSVPVISTKIQIDVTEQRDEPIPKSTWQSRDTETARKLLNQKSKLERGLPEEIKPTHNQL